jgi:MtrB/PioB family decaheme-associated outer membrane protein
MRTHSPLFLLAALGVLSSAGPAVAQVDTSQWKCEKCPVQKGTTGQVQAGAIYVSDDSTTFGNYTGLDSKGGYLDLGGKVSHRGPDGYWAEGTASDLGLDIRSLEAQAGREGLYHMRLGYAEIPRYFAEGARTPFLGNGTGVLTLPAGYPQPTTATMGSLQPIELGVKARRFDLSGNWIGQENWTFRASLRRDVKDGTQPTYGSFSSSAAQLAQPVDYTTDQFEIAAHYATARLQASLGWHLSQFRNGKESLTWDNPFGAGATVAQGQLALAPDNEFSQIFGAIGYQVTPQIRASADVAAGRGTQNSNYLASTLNPALTVPGLPANSLDGRTDTWNGNVKVTYAPIENLRLNAIYAWDVRDNRTDVLAYPHVTTDLFVSPELRSNTPFDLTQNRFRLNGDYRGPGSWKINGGVDWDRRERNYHEVVTTDETTLWGRASVQALEAVAVSFNLAYGDRDPSTYGTATWFGSPQNPLMRKYSLAARQRTTGGARADWTVSETFTVGLGVDATNDDYDKTQIGLQESESFNVSLDATYVLNDRTRLYGFAQGERMKSTQAGSQLYGAPDWTGRVEDEFGVVGVGVKFVAIPDKLNVGADVSLSRARSDVAVQTVLGEPPFPKAKATRDVLKVFADYRLNEKMTIVGSWWYEQYDSADWHVDGVQPDTVSNLLAFGNQAPRYNQNVVRLSVRYAF